MSSPSQHGRSPTRSTRGMVASPHHLASTAGHDALREDGSAVDWWRLAHERYGKLRGRRSFGTR